MITIPGLSVTIGMNQSSHEPFARIRGRSGIFNMTKELDLMSNKGLLLLAGAAILANAASKAKAKADKPKPKKAPTKPKIEAPFKF